MPFKPPDSSNRNKIRRDNIHEDMNEPACWDEQGGQSVILSDFVIAGISQRIVEERNSVDVTLSCELTAKDSGRKIRPIVLGHHDFAENHAKGLCMLHHAEEHGFKVINPLLVIVEWGERVIGPVNDGIAKLEVDLN